jgi:hypothetical protein
MASCAESTKIKLNIEASGLGMTFRELPFRSDTTLRVLKQNLFPRTGLMSGLGLFDSWCTLKHAQIAT